MKLDQKYNRDEFLLFLKSFIPAFDKDIRPVNADKLKVSKDVFYLGKSEVLDLNIFEITHSTTSDARISLAIDGFRVMKNSAIYKALIIYRADKGDDWRLSLMTAAPGVNEKGKVGQTLSNPRRFSYFLGPNAKVNTPYRFLIKEGGVKDFAELEKRFSLEVVNKEFYKKIQEAYYSLVGGTLGAGKKARTFNPLLHLPSQAERSQQCLEFAVRLIGRIIFCWFLREKKGKSGTSLMPKELLSLNAINKNKDFYHKILEPIFFELLNKPIRSRMDEYAGNLYSLIPYLNGGLFSPHYEDFYKRKNGDQSIYHNTLKVPDKWFEELFDTLELYNFTIDENSSFDEELSIDPEMLGRIFENLLAEINPETGESARKSTGSYYTPRPIVDYMVDESLFQYLKQKTNIEENKLRAVISYDLTDDALNPLDNEDKQKIIDALVILKLLDAACGSGAFPIGALQKIVFILQQADPEGQLWFKKQIKNTPPEIRKVIEREFSHKNFDYIRKLGIIRENIFGVDIQPIATEISRLRCFLTLVVDERVDDSLENRGIEPLPNLDFKFVTANTLISLPSANKIAQTGLFEDTEGIEDLKEIRDAFFNAYGPEREELKLKFVQKQNNMFQKLISNKSFDHAELTTKLTSWEPFSNQSSSWFDPEWMFGIKDGFDIVIGNPPYIFTRDAGFSDEFKKHIAINYFSLLTSKDKKSKANQSGKINLFALFILRGLFACKNKGLLSFIVPNNLLRTTTYDLVRKYILDNAKVEEVVDLGSGVFDNATASTIIIELNNEKNNFNHKIKIITKIKNIERQEFEATTIEQNQFLKNVSYTFNIFANSSTNALLAKISDKKECLGIFCIDIIAGIDAPKHLISELNTKNSFPLIEGKTITKFALHPINKYLIWKTSEINRTRPDYIWDASQKIVIQRISGGHTPLVATIDKQKNRAFNSVNCLILKDQHQKDYEYILALINSRVLNWYYANSFSNNSELTVNISKTFLEKLPIPKISKKAHNSITTLVDKIIMYKEKNPEADTHPLEKQLDELVYKLYDLTEDEIKAVEGAEK